MMIKDIQTEYIYLFFTRIPFSAREYFNNDEELVNTVKKGTSKHCEALQLKDII